MSAWIDAIRRVFGGGLTESSPVLPLVSLAPGPTPGLTKSSPVLPKPTALPPADEKLLVGVHPDLVRVILRARREGAVFRILEGLRTKERQAMLVSKGASKTMNSRHITGHAVDIAPLVNGSVTWDWKFYFPLATAVKLASRAEAVSVEWGGDWVGFPDGPHWQLPARAPYLTSVVASKEPSA